MPIALSVCESLNDVDVLMFLQSEDDSYLMLGLSEPFLLRFLIIKISPPVFLSSSWRNSYVIC